MKQLQYCKVYYLWGSLQTHKAAASPPFVVMDNIFYSFQYKPRPIKH